jgi:hypothetical protein
MSEKVELFSSSSDNIIRLNLQNVESDSFRQRSALTGNNDITFFDTKTRGDVAGDVFMSFLETLIFLHVVEVISTDNHCVCHFGGNDHSSAINSLT